MTFGNFSILSVHIEFQIKKIHHPLYYTSALLFRRHERLIHTRFACRRGLLDMILKYALSIYFLLPLNSSNNTLSSQVSNALKEWKIILKKFVNWGSEKERNFSRFIFYDYFRECQSSRFFVVVVLFAHCFIEFFSICLCVMKKIYMTFVCTFLFVFSFTHSF